MQHSPMKFSVQLSSLMTSVSLGVCMTVTVIGGTTDPVSVMLAAVTDALKTLLPASKES